MGKKTPGKRIQEVRKHFGLTQDDLSAETGIPQSNISRAETSQNPVSDAILYGLMVHYAVNPEWVMTGEGEMFTAPEEYLVKGIRALGVKKIGEGLSKVLNDPEFSEIHGYIELNKIVPEGLDKIIIAYLKHIVEQWQQGNEDDRIWLKGQLYRAFPDFFERNKESLIDKPKD